MAGRLRSKAGSAAVQQPSDHAMRPGLAALRQVQRPGTGEVGPRDPVLGMAGRVPQVDDVLAVHGVGAQEQGFEAMREAGRGLAHGCHRGQGEIEGRLPAQIEATAAKGCAAARQRRPGPPRIVGAVDIAHKPQAYPPVAT